MYMHIGKTATTLMRLKFTWMNTQDCNGNQSSVGQHCVNVALFYVVFIVLLLLLLLLLLPLLPLLLLLLLPLLLLLLLSQYYCGVEMCRYNEGLVDIVASSVEMLGEPRQVFPTRTLSLGSPVL